MNDYSDFMKKRLTDIIEEMATKPDLFVKNPGKDFTRDRKLTFKTVVKILLSMNGNCLSKELLEYFSYDTHTVTSSAFIQQRQKLLPFAFEFLLNEFTNTYEDIKTFDGYRLLAVDGSDLNIPLNKHDLDTYIQSLPNSKGYNLLHLNAMYDLDNKLYVDALLQPRNDRNEFAALIRMVDRSTIAEPVILIADRGYESYNVFAHIIEKGWNYVIRVKDRNSNGILSAINLPDSDEFDITVHFDLTRKQTKAMKSKLKNYKFMPLNSRFDYFKQYSIEFYPISLRIVRFKISDTSYETIITNLESETFSPTMIKSLYHKRWGIETSFRELKYAVGLTNFHSKTMTCITQEIFARLIMYNFCEMITLHVIIKQKHTKYGYQANFTIAIQICKYFLSLKSDARPPDVEALIQKNILPIRDGRKVPRKVKYRSAVSFIYRVA